MLRNYLLTALRSLSRRKWMAIINLVGLSVGVAVGLLSFLHVRYELNYDGFHEKKDRIYRIVTGNMETGEGWVGISAPIPPRIKDEVPDVEEFVRLTKLRRSGKVVISNGTRHFNEANFFMADPSLFSVFSFPLKSGNKDFVLQNLDEIVISETQAEKLFGTEDPIGKLIRLNEEFEFRVAGVFYDIPPNSHLDIDYVVSFQNLEKLLPGTSLSENWGQFNYYAYALLGPNSSEAEAERRIQAINIQLEDDNNMALDQLGLQPIQDIHFQHNRGNLKPSYNMTYIYIYIAAALGVILISLVNFINLKTAGSSKRVREVGVRKVIGASLGQLRLQFMAESFVLTLLAFLLGILSLKFLFLPYVNNLFGVEIGLNLYDPGTLFIGFLATLLISLLAGAYIAFFVSSFSPVKALKNAIKVNSSKNVFRNLLLGIQFLISIVLVASSAVINKQMKFVSEKSLGLQPEQVINIPIYNDPDEAKLELLKSEIGRMPNVTSVSLNGFEPGNVNWNQTVWWEGQDESESMYIISVDEKFFETLDMNLLEGDVNLIKQRASSDRYTYVLNRAAREHIGWESALGKKFRALGGNSDRTIDGVVENFHFQSLHNEVKPCVLVIGFFPATQLYAKLNSKNINQSIGAIKSKTSEVLPGLPFEYQFLNSEFEQLYWQEKRAGAVISFFTIISIILAVSGLYGLLTFAINERTKELAVRKILGSSSYHLGRLLSDNFLKIGLVTALIGVPVTWWLMQNWLNNFNYRVDLSFLGLLLPLLLLAGAIFLTISIKVMGLMRHNPVDELKYE